MEETTPLQRNGIRVHKKLGEKVRQYLQCRNLLNTDLQIQKVDDQLIIPLKIMDPVSNLKTEIRGLDVPFDLCVSDFPRNEKKMTGDYRILLNDIDEKDRPYLPTSFDVIGDICIIKIPDEIDHLNVCIGNAIIASNSNIRGVFKDQGVHGEFRVRSVHHIGGEKRTVTTHREYGMKLIVDIDRVYFSPRLAGERFRISEEVTRSIDKIGRGERILDMFAGIGPFSICIARNNPDCQLHAIDLNPEAYLFLTENIEQNNTGNVISHLGDAGHLTMGLSEKEKFDRIIMNLPHHSIQFLTVALDAIERGVIHLYVIIPKLELSGLVRSIESVAQAKGRNIIEIIPNELKGYSATISYFSIDIIVSK